MITVPDMEPNTSFYFQNFSINESVFGLYDPNVTIYENGESQWEYFAVILLKSMVMGFIILAALLGNLLIMVSFKL